MLLDDSWKGLVSVYLYKTYFWVMIGYFISKMYALTFFLNRHILMLKFSVINKNDVYSTSW
jgi:hypothetical protein